MPSESQAARKSKAAAPKKAEKSRRDSNSDSDSDLSSTLDLSSDGGYSALDEASDDDDDDDNDVYAAEEEAIINDVTKPRHHRTSRPAARKEDESAIADDSDGDDADDDGDDDDDEPPADDKDNYSSGPDANVPDNASWNGILESDINNGSGQSPDGRHVRFAGVPDSDNESNSSTPTVSSDEFFPDVFVEKQCLDSTFRREIEEESDSSNSATFWDFSAPTNNALMDNLPVTDVANLMESEAAVSTALENMAGEGGVEAETEAGELDGSEGYESDGETTEDDEPQLLPQRRSFRNAQPDAEDSSDSDSESFMPVRNHRGQPRIGRFVLSGRRTKPIAVINPVTKKMVIFTPEAPRAAEVSTEPIPFSYNGNPLRFFPANDDQLAQSSPLHCEHNPYLFSDPAAQVGHNSMIHSDPVGGGLGGYSGLGMNPVFNEDSDEVSVDFRDYEEDAGEHTLRIEDFICFDRNSDADGSQGAALGEAPNTTFDATDVADIDQLFDTSGIDASLAKFPPGDVEAVINGIFGDDPFEAGDPFFETGLALDMSSSVLGLDENIGLSNNGLDHLDDGAMPADATPTADATLRAANATSGAAAADPLAVVPENAKPDSPPLHPLMAHFSKNTDVGAFRRNQINQQLISSNKATEESLAFSGPLSMGTLRGIKHGSLSAVSAPLTPPRRPKRKALDDGPSTHKRFHSISEVKDLQL